MKHVINLFGSNILDTRREVTIQGQINLGEHVVIVGVPDTYICTSVDHVIDEDGSVIRYITAWSRNSAFGQRQSRISMG